MPEPSDPIRRRLPSRDSELPSLANQPVAPATKRGRRVALAILMLLAFIGVAWMAAPLWVGLVLGTVMAFTAQPLYRRLASSLGDRRWLASAITTLIGGITTAALGVATLYILTREAVLLRDWITTKVTSEATLADIIGENGAKVVDALGIQRESVMDGIRNELGNISKHAGEAAVLVAQTATGALLSLVIAAFTMYYVLIEWPHMAVRLERLLPLDPRHTRALMLEFRDVGRSAFIGTIATAIVQGTFAGVGFAIAGVPQPITWGVLTALASFLPVVGTAMIWVPMGVYLLLNQQPWWAVFTWAWGSLIVMAVSDYIIRPRLVGNKGHGHPLLMLIALLGGIEVFGLHGLITGPVLMSLFLAIVRIYEREVSADALTGPTGDGV